VHIAVIVPAFNVGLFLDDAITSVRNQTHSNWSLVIVDDGSTDATADIASHFQDPRIRLLRQPNAGVSSARNSGLAAVFAQNAHGMPAAAPSGTVPDAVLFLDADDWLASDALTILANTLQDAPWAVASCGRYARVAPDGATHRSPQPPHGNLLERLLTRNLFANGGHVLIRREAIETAGPFRTDLCYGEDWEYWTRLALLGEFMAAPTATPVLYVRERAGSAYLSHATDPAAYRPALDAIYANPDIAATIGRSRLAALGRRADAETAWAVGRELIRHGRQRDGQRWLQHSIRNVPSLKRLALIGLSWLRFGPFRPYRISG
jgi:glycosyltransferase involved in cell wall biosynthesis